jgi:site-specific recombinase XerD
MIQFAGIESVVFCPFAKQSPTTAAGHDSGRKHLYGALASLPLPAHPHMLRHACGFALADQGADTRLIQDYLGHWNIQHTVRYTATNPARFERSWR